MQVQFNTGRKYTRHGQRIIATLHDSLAVTFHDLDRMIDGEFQLDPGGHDLRQFFASKSAAASVVLRRYDGGDYASTARSHAAAFALDGENAGSKWGAQQ